MTGSPAIESRGSITGLAWIQEAGSRGSELGTGELETGELETGGNLSIPQATAPKLAGSGPQKPVT
jgi:hypothetical protein